jgi:hypothetical protein
MLKFKKVKESIERFDTWCHLVIRDLKSNQNFTKFSDSEIIDEIIKSKFHYWRGEEEPDGQTITLSYNNKSKTLKNFKFYGIFNDDMISSSNYKIMTFEEFKAKILASIIEFADDDHSFEIKAQNLLIVALNPESTYYHLDLNEDINVDYIAEWTPYSKFIAFISLNRQNNIASLIEFGQD